MGNKSIKILAIDDNQDNLVSLKALIKDAFPNALTLTALNGERGLELAAAEDPDVILLDIVMPGLDGYEVCQRLKADKNMREIPVIFVTAIKGDRTSRLRALEVGAEAFLAKPIDESELTVQIRTMVKIKTANIEKRNEKERLAELVAEQTHGLKRAHLATLNLLEDLKRENESRKKSEEALRKSEESLADIFQTVTEGIGYATLSGEVVFVNAALERIVEIPKEELIGKNVLFLVKDFLSFENAKRVMTILSKLIQGKSIESFHFEYKNKILEVNAIVNKQSRRIVGVLRDITQRVRAEEELRKSEERFRSLIENAFDGIYLTNGKYFYYVNNRFCEMLGYTPQELTSPDFDFDITLSEKSHKLVNERSLLRKLGKKVPGTYEIQVTTKGGTFKNVEVSTVNLGIGDELNVMGIVRDVSERKKMESQIIQAERMSALGEMAAGIAHEINQPLTTLSLAFDNVLFDAKSNQMVDVAYLHSKTDKIFENIQRIRNIIDHIRAFSRNQDEYILSAFDINESVRNALSMVSVQYKIAGIEVDFQPEEKIPSIVGNIYKFEQVILNLISNAKDALLEKKVKLQKNYPMSITIRSFTDKKHIYLEVEDNGIGIKPENIDKLLLPFYTTKETGKGTGLGLSISHGLIKEMDGSIEIHSKVIKGTTITIMIPMPEKK